MRHALGIFAIIAIVGIATLLLSVSYNPEPTPAAITLYSSAPVDVGNTVVVRLDVGETICNEAQTITENHLIYLKSGTVHARGHTTDYIQNLEFCDPAQFEGGKVVFGRTEDREVVDFLEFPDAVFKLKIEFEQGLRSQVQDGELGEIENENIDIMGGRFVIVDTDVNPSTGGIALKLFGGFGSIEFEDNNFRDSDYYRGVKVNGKYVDALVRIRAVGDENQVSIYSIHYILNANAANAGDLQVTPFHCVREFLQYPGGMLVPHFDICYKVLEGGVAVPSEQGISGNRIYVRAAGDDEYVMTATNNHGTVYKIPLAQLPGSYGNKGRNMVFVEAPNSGAPNINLNDYFVVNSRDDIGGVSHVLRYNQRAGNTIYFEDLGGNQRSSPFDPSTGEGQLMVGEGTYRFFVGAGDSIAMDQNNDGAINGGEARFVVMGGILIDFGPGFTVRIIVPQRLFDEPAGDEVTRFDILFGDHIDLSVPSPQGEMTLQSMSGRKQGMTRYGVFFDWDTESDSDDLTIAIPGAGTQRSVVRGGAQGEVFISLERERLMHPDQQQAAPVVKCGDSLITQPEYCDPPGSVCTRPGVPKGICADDCMSCKAPSGAVCGNNLIDPAEDCEKSVDCPVGKVCQQCKCVPKPAPVCGNNLIEAPEQCEKDVDCPAGNTCVGCQCTAPVPVYHNCQFAGKCRIWDNSCGGNGMELLMEDGVPAGCVDAYESASQGVDYCGKFVSARGSVDCNYQSGNKKDCICPSRPETQLPSFVAKPSWLTRFWWAVKNFFRPVPVTQYPSQTGTLPVGAVCQHGGECATGYCVYESGEGAERTYKCSCDAFKLTGYGC